MLFYEIENIFIKKHLTLYITCYIIYTGGEKMSKKKINKKELLETITQIIILVTAIIELIKVIITK